VKIVKCKQNIWHRPTARGRSKRVHWVWVPVHPQGEKIFGVIYRGKFYVHLQPQAEQEVNF